MGVQVENISIRVEEAFRINNTNAQIYIRNTNMANQKCTIFEHSNMSMVFLTDYITSNVIQLVACSSVITG